jgi:hypothetical protein
VSKETTVSKETYYSVKRVYIYADTATWIVLSLSLSLSLSLTHTHTHTHTYREDLVPSNGDEMENCDVHSLDVLRSALISSMTAKDTARFFTKLNCKLN